MSIENKINSLQKKYVEIKHEINCKNRKNLQNDNSLIGLKKKKLLIKDKIVKLKYS